MKPININFLETLEKDTRVKDTRSSGQSDLIIQCRNILDNMFDFIKNLKVCETVSVVRSHYNWMNSKSKFSNSKFNIRDIVEVDLGVGYGYEMCYKHPCIVLHDSNAGFCLVVPCSTGKYGKNNKFILDGEPCDGFQYPTGVLIDAVRCISKTRMANKVGEITVLFLDRINTILLEIYFSRNDLKIRNLEKDLKSEKGKNMILMNKFEKLIELSNNKGIS